MLGIMAVLAAMGASNADIPPASEVTLRHEIYQDSDVTAYALDIPPKQGTQMHRHDKDLLTVFLSKVSTTAVFEGSGPTTDAPPAGTVRYRMAGFSHSTRNNDPSETFHAILLEFKHPTGARGPGNGSPTLFCTPSICVDDLSVGGGSSTPSYASALFIAVTHLDGHMAHQAQGKLTPGSIWRGKGAWSNANSTPARLIAVYSRY